MNPNPHPKTFTVAIIGGGPSGLALARLLHLNQIPFTLFERELSPSIRSQGGSLDIHVNTGQRFLKEAGLWGEIEMSLRWEGETKVVVDERYNRVTLKEGVDGKEGGRPELDREVLRRVLIKSIPEDRIRWGSHIKTVSEDGKIHFVSGEEESGFDLIVGADGAWSIVRPLLSGSTSHPTYTGISGIELQSPNVDEMYPELSKMVGNGSICGLGNNISLIAQRNGDGSVRIYAWGRRSESWVNSSGIDFNDPSAVKAAILKDYADWDSRLHRLIADTSDEILLRVLYTLPPDHTWSTKPGFTLIGDAAHLMPPNGEGVNLALIDALDLAEAISQIANSQSKDSEEALRFIEGFEKKMLERSNISAVRALEIIDVMYQDGAEAGKFVDWFKGMMAKARGTGDGSIST